MIVHGLSNDVFSTLFPFGVIQDSLLYDWKVLNLDLTLASPCLIIQFKEINQPDARVSQVYYLTFMCGSTCFGRLHAHHQELTTALATSGFTVGAWR
jgi:hypothetical protein